MTGSAFVMFDLICQENNWTKTICVVCLVVQRIGRLTHFVQFYRRARFPTSVLQTGNHAHESSVPVPLNSNQIELRTSINRHAWNVLIYTCTFRPVMVKRKLKRNTMKLSGRRNGSLLPDEYESDSDVIQEFALPKKRIIKPGKSAYTAR